MKKITLGVLVIASILGIVFLTVKNTQKKIITNVTDKVFCGAENNLVAEKPIQSHRSYCIKTLSKTTGIGSNKPFSFRYLIIDDEGNTLKGFDTVHEKQMHFIAVRKDLAYFQHVHPDFDSATGIFTLSALTLPAEGEYRLFADFTPTSGMMGAQGGKLPVTIYTDIRTENAISYKPQPIGTPLASKTFDGYSISLSTNPHTLVTGVESMLTFNLKEKGKPITDLEKYLGALGHSVILREGDLQFIHAHPVEDFTKPQTGNVNFMVDFPEAGKYKMFTQFQRNGKVTTTDFVVDVVLGQSNQSHQGGMMMH